MVGSREIPQQEKYQGFSKEPSDPALGVSELVKHSNIDILVNLTDQQRSHCQLNLSFPRLGWRVEKSSGETSTSLEWICIISTHPEWGKNEALRVRFLRMTFQRESRKCAIFKLKQVLKACSRFRFIDFRRMLIMVIVVCRRWGSSVLGTASHSAAAVWTCGA